MVSFLRNEQVGRDWDQMKLEEFQNPPEGLKRSQHGEKCVLCKEGFHPGKGRVTKYGFICEGCLPEDPKRLVELFIVERGDDGTGIRDENSDDKSGSDLGSVHAAQGQSH